MGGRGTPGKILVREDLGKGTMVRICFVVAGITGGNKKWLDYGK
jgi:hypothetical protein